MPVIITPEKTGLTYGAQVGIGVAVALSITCCFATCAACICCKSIMMRKKAKPVYPEVNEDAEIA
jgi:hypothetical protein